MLRSGALWLRRVVSSSVCAPAPVPAPAPARAVQQLWSHARVRALSSSSVGVRALWSSAAPAFSVGVRAMSGAAAAAGSSAQRPPQSPPPPPVSTKPLKLPPKGEYIEVTPANISQLILNKDTLFILDCYADWCEPCHKLAPVLQHAVRTSASNAIVLGKLNTDAYPQFAQQLRVQSLPTVFFFRDGKIVDGFVGVSTAESIRKMVDAHAPANAPGAGAGAADVAGKPSLHRAKELLQSRAYVKAIAEFDQVLGDVALRTSHFEALLGKLRAAVAAGQLDVATAAQETLKRSYKKSLQDNNEVQVAFAEYDIARLLSGQKDIARRVGELRSAAPTAASLYELGLAEYATGNAEGAVDALLQSVRSDRRHNDEAARKLLVDIFSVLGVQHPVAVQGRRRLSAMLSV